jgi:CDP-paratose 2-epimerase
VAVTTSVVDPAADFAVNAQGTLNLLEAVRACPTPPPLLFTSTNKVYGALEDLALERLDSRYMPTVGRYQNGIDETRPLEFHSPYGCSKGAADQYVLDYARSYGLPSAVFRMSCIYGPHQCGNEDQGWVAHFLIRAIERQRITLYGDGRQVRDILYVDDLIDAMLLAQSRMAGIAGQAFNIGGGPRNAVSLAELLDRIERLTGRAPRVEFGPWRTGDQRYYVSDHRAFTRATGWQPRIHVEAGVSRLHAWLVENGVAARPAAAGAAARRPAAAAAASSSVAAAAARP